MGFKWINRHKSRQLLAADGKRNSLLRAARFVNLNMKVDVYIIIYVRAFHIQYTNSKFLYTWDNSWNTILGMFSDPNFKISDT
jgi:hypothetical protein